MDSGASSYHRFLEGDKKAFEELVRLYSDSLVCFAYCFVHDADAAEDVAADTFAVLLVKRKKFTENAKFKTWLYRIARNKCIDLLRRNRVTPFNDVEKLLRGDAEREYFERERDRQIYLAMQRLPTDYRNVLYLVYFDGFNVDEVCKIMRKSNKQVYNLLARAKSRLKEILLKDGFYENLQ